MQKFAIILFGLVLAGIAQACISIPVIEAGDASFSVGAWMVYSYANTTGDANVSAEQFGSYMAYTYGGSWAAQQLTPGQTAAIWDFIRHGYSVKKMAPGEYARFLENASATNADLSTCDYYSAVAYRDGFAGYAIGAKRPECMTYDMKCVGGPVTLFINDLANPPLPEAPPDAGGEISQDSPLTGSAASANSEQGQGAAGNAQGSAPPASSLMRDAAIGGAVIFVLAAFGAYVIVTRRPESEQMPEAELHRALSSETRIALLKELMQRDLTPTDLSTKVGKSKATVVEHLDRLRDNGFVEKKEEEGRKFVFYGLTRKGKDVLRRAG